MKFSVFVFLIVSIFFTLNGCSSSTISRTTSEVMDTIESSTEATVKNNREDVVHAALKEIGVNEIKNIKYENYEENLFTSVDAYVETDIRNLIVKCRALDDDWSVSYIINEESKHEYYPTTGKYAYNYITDEPNNPEIVGVEESTTQPPETESSTEAETSLEADNDNSLDVRNLKMNGEPIIDMCERDMAEGYDYIREVGISVDDTSKRISIVVIVPSSVNEELAKEAGEDVARYLASLASYTNSYYKIPGLDDIGGLYDRYDLLVAISNNGQNFIYTGAKAISSSNIFWSK